MQPARFRQEDFLLVEINNAKFTKKTVKIGVRVGIKIIISNTALVVMHSLLK